MCCFSGEVRDVSGTSIFSRVRGGRQTVVYSMQFSSDQDVAMVLPIPVATATTVGEQDVEFFAMDEYPEFFTDLASLFVEPAYMARAAAEPTLALADDLLEVQRVGAFEASFVPSMADFERLDPRFRIDTAVWERAGGGEYAAYGFVVFQLRAGDDQDVHPMAFEFPTRHPGRLFFPTVHVHDGSFHDDAEFSHVVYGQLAEEDSPEPGLGEGLFVQVESPVGRLTAQWASRATADKLDWSRLPDVIGRAGACFRAMVNGARPNRDLWIDGATLTGRSAGASSPSPLAPLS